MKNNTKRIKLTKKDAVILLICFAILLIAAVIICSSGTGFGKSEIINVSTAEGREEYLKGYGWEIDKASEDFQEILLPEEFGDNMKDYLKMQNEQGYDFSSCCGMECSKYTYVVTNYPNYSGTVYAVLYIRGCRVLGGDIHAADMNGFMHGIK
ncbi:MAG: DUF4830 domain-containing protein [Bacillota bacterium]|nr:DUF4830 domain-containing protein [Bacillota bacterium]